MSAPLATWRSNNEGWETIRFTMDLTHSQTVCIRTNPLPPVSHVPHPTMSYHPSDDFKPKRLGENHMPRRRAHSRDWSN